MAPVGAAAAYAGGAAEKKSNRSPAFWILLTLGVIAVGIAAVLVGRAIFGSPAVEKVAVPNLAGLTIAEAQTALEKNGLVLGSQTPQPSEDRPKDTIISQNPVERRAGRQGQLGRRHRLDRQGPGHRAHARRA